MFRKGNRYPINEGPVVVKGPQGDMGPPGPMGPVGVQGPPGPPGPILNVGVIGPQDRLLILLKGNIGDETFQKLHTELVKMNLGTQAIIFNGDIVESLVIIPAPVDKKDIIKGSRNILEEMKIVDDEQS